jgi:hypothetical protein
MAPPFVPVLTITAPDGTQVTVTIFGLPAKEEELASAADFRPFEEEESSAPVMTSGQTLSDAGKYLPSYLLPTTSILELCFDAFISKC